MDVTVNSLGCNIHERARVCTKHASLTNHRFNILLRTRSAAVRHKCASRTKSEGERFVVLAKIVVDLAREKRGRVVRLLREPLSLVQRLAVASDA